MLFITTDCTLFHIQQMEERCSFSYSYFLVLFIYLSVAQKLCVLLNRFTKKDVK